mgnify:CR=1 FL=1
MGFRRKLRWLILVLMLLLLFTGCGDLEPDMQDTRTVILNMDFHGKSSSRSSSSVSASELSQYNTHLILALPSGEVLTSSYKNFYSSFAQGLMNTADKKVSLEIPLNTQMKIFAFLFKENYSMSELFSGTREVGYYGESQSFSIGTQTNNLSLSITLIQVPGTNTDGEADTTPPANTSISINSNTDNATSTSVTLAISATDNVGVTGYYASESSTTPEGSASWTSVTSTTSYSANVSFTLSSVDNEIKTVYIWFKDSAGNISSPASDTIRAVYYYNWKLIARQVDGNGDGSFTVDELFKDYDINGVTYTVKNTFLKNADDSDSSAFMSIGNLTPSNYVTDGKYKFKLEWNGKTVSSSSPPINKEVTWTQTSWLTDSTYDDSGFQEIGVSGFSFTGLDDGHRFVGLWKSTHAKCVFDGDGGGHPNWWNCVGAIGIHSQGGEEGIPGPLQKIASSMHLYIWSPSNL